MVFTRFFFACLTGFANKYTGPESLHVLLWALVVETTTLARRTSFTRRHDDELVCKSEAIGIEGLYFLA